MSRLLRVSTEQRKQKNTMCVCSGTSYGSHCLSLNALLSSAIPTSPAPALQLQLSSANSPPPGPALQLSPSEPLRLPLRARASDHLYEYILGCSDIFGTGDTDAGAPTLPLSSAESPAPASAPDLSSTQPMIPTPKLRTSRSTAPELQRRVLISSLSFPAQPRGTDDRYPMTPIPEIDTGI